MLPADFFLLKNSKDLSTQHVTNLDHHHLESNLTHHLKDSPLGKQYVMVFGKSSTYYLS